MKFSELKEKYQKDLNQQIDKLVEKRCNTPYVIDVYTHTRRFYARRVCKCWSDDRGNCMPFGGGSYWTNKGTKREVLELAKKLGFNV